MFRWSCWVGLVLLAGCGATGPSDSTERDSKGPRLRVSGTVQSAATGAAIAGATVFFMFQPAFSSWRDAYALTQATTDSTGRYSMEIGPPPGYAAPNCSTLHLEVSAPGYQSGWVTGLGGSCSGSIEHEPITLNPLPRLQAHSLASPR